MIPFWNSIYQPNEKDMEYQNQKETIESLIGKIENSLKKHEKTFETEGSLTSIGDLVFVEEKLEEIAYFLGERENLQKEKNS